MQHSIISKVTKRNKPLFSPSERIHHPSIKCRFCGDRRPMLDASRRRTRPFKATIDFLGPRKNGGRRVESFFLIVCVVPDRGCLPRQNSYLHLVLNLAGRRSATEASDLPGPTQGRLTSPSGFHASGVADRGARAQPGRPTYHRPSSLADLHCGKRAGLRPFGMAHTRHASLEHTLVRNLAL